MKSRQLTAAATWLAPARFERPSRARGRGVRDAAASDGAISDRLIQIGVVAALVGTLVQTSAHLTNAFLLDSRFDQLSAEVDWSIFSWASSVATFAGALAALILAVAVPVRRRRFAFLAAALVFFSLDDIARAHENVAHLLENALNAPDYFGRLLWEIAFAPLLVLTFLLLWRTAQETSARPRRSIQRGLLLLAAAIAAEGLMIFWFAAGGERGGWPHVLEVALEEAAELAGWIAISSGLIAATALTLFRLGRDHASHADS